MRRSKEYAPQNHRRNFRHPFSACNRDVSHYLIKLIPCSAFGMHGVMPRLARLDAPGILHHVIIRGIERKNIFRDTTDKQNLVDRLDQLIPQTQTSCYAWVLLSNHFLCGAPHKKWLGISAQQ